MTVYHLRKISQFTFTKCNKLQLIPLVLLYTILLAQNNINAYTLDKVLAIVDENIILESDIKKIQIFNDKYNEIFFHKKKNEKSLSKKEILDQLIADTLILQLAKRANIYISDNQIENIIDYIAEKNHITKEELKSYLTRNNINYSSYVNHIKNDITINTICNYEMQQRIKISPYEINTLTNTLILKNSNISLQLNHILIPLQEYATNYQIQKTYLFSTFLAKEMKLGVNINTLSKIYSYNKTLPIIQINNIPWSTIEELPTLFSGHFLFNEIYINNIIGPIRSSIGFHILKINDIDNHIKQNFITKIHIRHILIKKSNINHDQQIQTKLLKIKEDIKNNRTTFSIEARQISEDTNSSNSGGDLGWKYLKDFDKTFQNAITPLKKEEITSPIKTKHGWHLIQLIDSKQVDKNRTFYLKHARQIIFNKKLHDTMNHWIEELKTLTYIKILKDDN